MTLRFEQFINENLHLLEREFDEGKENELEDILKRYKSLSDEIESYREQFEQEIKPLTDEENELHQKIMNLMDELGYSTKQVDEIVAKYKQPHQQSSVSYKKLFTEALKKVNESTRQVLEELRDQYTKISEYSAKLKVQSYDDMKKAQKGAEKHQSKNQINENVLSKAWDKIKNLLSDVYNSLVGKVQDLKSSVEELEQAAQQES